MALKDSDRDRAYEAVRAHLQEVGRDHEEVLVDRILSPTLGCDPVTSITLLDAWSASGHLFEHPPEAIPGSGTGWPPREQQRSYSLPNRSETLPASE
jgi:hypothetical protein